jgi:hypothetical protein
MPAIDHPAEKTLALRDIETKMGRPLPTSLARALVSNLALKHLRALFEYLDSTKCDIVREAFEDGRHFTPDPLEDW